MKDRPILFSGVMVRAILAGEKTQTRRVVKNVPEGAASAGVISSSTDAASVGEWWWLDSTDLMDAGVVGEPFRCPYGQPGDRLWVRETWFREPHPSDLGLTYEDMPHTWAFAVAKAGSYLYRADAGSEIAIDGRQWRPSIHMPRWASRITLEVTGVRVERLQECSHHDAIAEGVHRIQIGSGYPDQFSANPTCWADVVEQQADAYEDARFAYRDLWESINGTGSWAANPWVWAVEFKPVTP